MTDSGYPDYLNSNDNYQNKEEITEKPYYNDSSAPVPQNIPNQNSNNNYNEQPYYNQQPNYYNNNYITQNIPNYNTKNNYANPLVQSSLPVQNTNSNKKLKIYSILLIIFGIIDIIIQIIFQFFSPYCLGDDIALFILSTIYLTFICKGKSAKNSLLGSATVFVWFVGFGVKGFAMTQIRDKPAAIVIDFFLVVARSLTIFLCIPLTCA